MKINPKIMLRMEDDFGLFYDGNNGNTVTISLEDAKAIQSNNIEHFTRKNRQAVLLELQKKGFMSLSEKIEQGSSVLGENDIKPASVLTLRSTHSPYKVLWAVTPKCNMKCLYCWPDVASLREEYPGLDAKDLKKIAKQLVDSQVCKVIISGGEALLCKEIWEIIEILRAGGCTVMMISNGTTITDEVLEKVKANNVALGISFDSSKEEVNSITRRTKVVARVTESIRMILAKNIPMAALITVTKYNFDHIKEHVAYLDSLGVKVVVLQDLKPFGTAEIYNETKLTKEQEMAAKDLIEYLIKKYPHIRFDPTELLYFSGHPNKNGTIMICDAGENGGYIDFRGDFMPCSFLSNYTYGNVLKRSLVDLWRNSDMAKKLKTLREIKVDELACCNGCEAIENCDGGCRADALLSGGDFFGPASRCPKKMGILNACCAK